MYCLTEDFKDHCGPIPLPSLWHTTIYLSTTACWQYTTCTLWPEYDDSVWWWFKKKSSQQL